MRIAVLDLYEGEANEGMRCIFQLLEQFKATAPVPVDYQVFDVRLKNEIADLSFDVYLSSGGPGSPLTSAGSAWEENYFGLMNQILDHNRRHLSPRKHVLLICHSFQIFCRYYAFAKVTKRRSTAFGIMPVHKTKAGLKEFLFARLDDPFYSVDSRDYQILQPDEGKIRAGGGEILCLEKERPFVALERAIMAIRFTDAIVGTQFHPEADSEGMHMYLVRDDKKKMISERHGAAKYQQMLQMVNQPDKLLLTYHTIIPAFLNNALNH
jgi:GMP synthase-like glutamine amidotransferase